MEYRLTTPCTAEDLAPLKAGDTVLLSGVVYTARDQAHKRMIEALDKGEALPFDLFTALIFLLVSLTSHSLNRFRRGVKSLSMPPFALSTLSLTAINRTPFWGNSISV